MWYHTQGCPSCLASISSVYVLTGSSAEDAGANARPLRSSISCSRGVKQETSILAGMLDSLMASYCCSAYHAIQLIDISPANMSDSAEEAKPGMLWALPNERIDSMLDIVAVFMKV